MKVVPYEDPDAVRWDDFVARTFAGTFLHTRRFLSYQGDRFRDVSLLLEDEKNSLVGVFPTAVEPAALEAIYWACTTWDVKKTTTPATTFPSSSTTVKPMLPGKRDCRWRISCNE